MGMKGSSKTCLEPARLVLALGREGVVDAVDLLLQRRCGILSDRQWLYGME